MEDPTIVKLVTIIVIGVILLTAVVGIIIVAVTTDRNLVRAESLAFGGGFLLALMGGVTWSGLRHRRSSWHIEREDVDNESDS